MNTNRYMMASAAAAVAFFFYGFVVNVIMLDGFYMENLSQQMFRPEGSQLMWAIMLSCILQALVLGYIFLRNYEAKGWMEGVRFGFWIALFYGSVQLISFALMPISANVLLVGVIADGLGYICLGAVFALVYKS